MISVYIVVLFIATHVCGQDQSCTVPDCGPPFALTNYGKVQGRLLKSRNGRDFYSYTKIPYAQPPVGDNRFKVNTENV